MEPLPLTSHCTGPAPCGSCGLAHCLEALGSCRITWLRACRKTATLPGRQKMEALEVCTSKRCHVACVACLACIACIACIACVRKRIPETEPSESPRRQTRALRALSLKERPTDKPRNLPESSTSHCRVRAGRRRRQPLLHASAQAPQAPRRQPKRQRPQNTPPTATASRVTSVTGVTNAQGTWLRKPAPASLEAPTGSAAQPQAAGSSWQLMAALRACLYPAGHQTGRTRRQREFRFNA